MSHSTSQIEEDAVGWAAEMAVHQRGDHLSKVQLAQFEAWLAADPQHVKAYMEAKRCWDSIADAAL